MKKKLAFAAILLFSIAIGFCIGLGIESRGIDLCN